MMALSLSLLFNDGDIVLIDKPSGLSVHRGMDSNPDTVVDRLREMGIDASPVHRLDRGTSGVLVCARASETRAKLSKAFEEGSIKKTYIALVRGAVTETIDIDHPVPVRELGPRVDAVTVVTPLATVQCESSALREKRYSLVRAEPKTGRFHQVRRHLKHIGHPIIGDANYGRSEHTKWCREQFGLARLALHAYAIELPNEPLDRIRVTSAIPSDLSDPLLNMGFSSRQEFA
jgi:tRNA pseudouridine65 synthase